MIIAFIITDTGSIRSYPPGLMVSRSGDIWAVAGDQLVVLYCLYDGRWVRTLSGIDKHALFARGVNNNDY